MKTTLRCLCFLILVYCNSCGSPSNATPSPSTGVYLETTVTPSRNFVIPSIVVSNTLTPTTTPIASPTWTPLPTLSRNEAQIVLQNLYSDNAGCKLPCWWGISPGLTKWLEAKRELEPVAVEFYSPAARANPTSYEVLVQSESDDWYPYPRRQVYGVKDGIIIDIKINIVNLRPYADLMRLVRNYGSPQEIWVTTGVFEAPPSSKTIFELVLFYEEQGIMARYQDVSASIADGEIIGCPQKLYQGSELFLWESIDNLSFSKSLGQFEVLAPGRKYLPLEDATGITVQMYVDELIGDAAPACLRTQLDLWVE